ncbi:MAG TPA: hypothetical protein VHF25_08975 [Nitriliruptorales bacterium]|nr:hypothetical protein [Nitriliruptorales bacterium]
MTPTTVGNRTKAGAESGQRRGRWLDAEVDGRSVRSWVVVGSVIAAVTLGFGAWWTYGLGRGGPMGGMGQVAADAPRVPPVFGYYDGEPIAFIHTEVSDPIIARLLGSMMGSPVPVVPALAKAPDETVGTVYVFTNGIVPRDTPAGPIGFQPDVFDSAPGDETYSPLREIIVVTWTDQDRARVLTTAGEVEAAAADGSTILEPTGVVVNMPLLTWPGGGR